VVHADTSAYIALADATTDWQHRGAQCLLKKDLLAYDFLSITNDEFVHVSVQPSFETQLGNIVFQ
jgi:hypothetical protein